jgi:hypothetical protein
VKLKHYRLTAWMEGRRDLPLYTCDVQALDEADARRLAYLPDWGPTLRVTVPVTWQVAEVKARPSGSVLVPTDELARIKDQRDRALALLQGVTYERCTKYERPHCKADDPCWDCRRRALLAEVEGT